MCNRTKKWVWLVLIVMGLQMLLAACGPTPAAPQTPPGLSEPPADDAPLVLPGALNGKTWAETVALADGQTVNWWMWGGSDIINRWVNGWVKDELARRYNITLNQVPVAGPTEFINQVLGEQQAGNHDAGAVDLMWINGENFRTMREADLLYGPWAMQAPISRFIDWENPAIAFDFGFPVDGYELPYGSAQFVMGYNTARVPAPPRSMGALLDWIRANPGKVHLSCPARFHWQRLCASRLLPRHRRLHRLSGRF